MSHDSFRSERDAQVKRDRNAGNTRAVWLWPWAIAAIAFAIRALPYHYVFAKGRVFFIDNDAYYHLRRIVYAVERFPEILVRDPYLGFPDGARAIWPPYLDGAIGWLLWPFFDAGARSRIERVVVWIPPLVGAATVWALYRIAERHWGRGVAIAAAAILSVLSGHFWYSQLSFLDHHVVVSWLSCLLLGFALDSVARSPEGGRFATLRSGAWLGLLSGLGLLVWPGFVLFVALLQAGLFLHLTTRPGLAAARDRLRGLVALDVVGLAVVLPFTAFPTWPQWSDYSPVVLSRFQPWLFALLGAHAIACERLWRPGGRAARPGTRIVQAVALGLAGVGASLALIPELRGAASDALEWLGRTDSFQAMVGESRPLFDLRGAFTVEIAELRLSRFVYLFAPALVAMLVAGRRDVRFPVLCFLALWGASLFVMTLLQKRFFNSFSVPMSLVFGWSCVWLRAQSVERWKLGPWRRRLVSVGVAALALWLLLPTFAAYRAPAASLVAGLRGQPIPLVPRLLESFERQQLAEWLRDHTPPTSGLWDASASPEYGVLARWGEGHFLKYVAARPTVVGNFGDDIGREHFLLARSFYTAEPSRAAEVLEALGVRYLVISAGFERRPMALRLMRDDGAGLGRYRLVYEVPQASGGPGPAYKVFEFVPGAQIVGRAPPTSRVEVALALTSNLGRKFMYRNVTESDADGEYRLRLPYSNRNHPQATRPARAYRLSAAGKTRELIVEESQVREGSVVAGPEF